MSSVIPSPSLLVRFFVLTALAWAPVGLGILLAWQGGSLVAVAWFFGLWLLSLADLVFLVRASQALFDWVGAPDGPTGTGQSGPEKRTALAIQTFFWGVLKLACLGIFGMVLFRSSGAPVQSLFLGLGTLVVVSLGGGWMWSQRVFQNA